jgi:hypothetical protein
MQDRTASNRHLQSGHGDPTVLTTTKIMSKLTKATQILFLMCILAQTLIAQGVPSFCKEFRDLLRQRELKITTQPQRAALFPGEILEPIVVVQNTSSRPLTIPVIDVNSGIIVLSLKRKVEPMFNQHQYSGHLDRDVNFTPLVGKDLCSFPTTVLQPNEIKSFPFQFPNRMWSGSMVKSRMTAREASIDEGRNAFDLYLGNIQLRGFYEIEAFEKLASVCIREEKSDAIARSPDDWEQNPYCSLITLVKQRSKWYLITARGPASLSSHLNDLRLRTNAASPNQPPIVLYPGVVQVIAEFDSKPEVLSRQFPQDISAIEFLLTTQDGIRSFEDLQSAYRKRLQIALDKFQ